MATITKYNKTIKIVIYSRTVYLAEILYSCISRTFMLIDIKMKKKPVAELGDSDRLKIYVNPRKIYVNPGVQVHSNDLFSETTAPMILKFHMLHDKATGPQKKNSGSLVIKYSHCC